jgi:hypothetical protein
LALYRAGALRSHAWPDSSLRVPRDGSRLQRRHREPVRRSGAAESDSAPPRQPAGRGRVTLQRADRSCPYLSTLQPHFGHVHPPHIASAIDAGRRIAGMDVPQRGQAGLSDPMPHRPLVFDCLTTKTPTSTAAIASAMRPMPSMTRCAFLPEDCYAPARRTRLLARRSTARREFLIRAGKPHLLRPRSALGRRSGPARMLQLKARASGRICRILVWTSGRYFPSSRLESPRRCPMCGTRAARRSGDDVRSTGGAPQKWWKCLTP